MLHGILMNLNRDIELKEKNTTNIDPKYRPSSEINQQLLKHFCQESALKSHKIQFLASLTHLTDKNQTLNLKTLLENAETIRQETLIDSVIDLGLQRTMSHVCDLYYSPRGLRASLAVQLILSVLVLIPIPQHWQYLERNAIEAVLTTKQFDYRLSMGN